MTQAQCEAEGCVNDPVLYFAIIGERQCIRSVSLCDEHASEFYISCNDQYRKLSGYHYMPGTTCIDVESVVYDDIELVGWISLREVNGGRRFTIASGPFEASALIQELNHIDTPRPLSHHAMVDAINLLGGSVQDVLIRDIVYMDSGSVYRATIRMYQHQQEVLLDARPSDAFIVAVICDVPIFISDPVLEEALNSSPAPWWLKS